MNVDFPPFLCPLQLSFVLKRKTKEKLSSEEETKLSQREMAILMLYGTVAYKQIKL